MSDIRPPPPPPPPPPLCVAQLYSPHARYVAIANRPTFGGKVADALAAVTRSVRIAPRGGRPGHDRQRLSPCARRTIAGHGAGLIRRFLGAKERANQR